MFRHLLPTLMIPAALLAAGTVGYMLIEGWSWDDALYMTVITVSTVGFEEVHPLSADGRSFTVVLVLGGVFTLFFVATEGVRAVFSGEVRRLIGRQRMEKTLQSMKDHLIVCGYGRMGKLVCQEFAERGLPFVLIDKNADLPQTFAEPHPISIVGDATVDADLKRAGIERAKALVSAVPSDADNAYIVMSARFLNPELLIVARAEAESAEDKLIRAGADRVVSPYVIGGQRVAQAILRPSVIDFIELATSDRHLELQIEEATVTDKSPLAHVKLSHSGLRREHGIILVAVKKGDETVFNPAGDLQIEPGDVLIGLGSREQLDRLEAKAAGPTGA